MPIPGEFPALAHALSERKAERFSAAVAVLRRGLDQQSIRLVDLDEAKRALGHAFEEAWSRSVSEPFFHAGRWERQPEPLQKLYYELSASSLHNAISMQKKVDRSGLAGPVIEAMRRVLAEALPLAEAVVELKPFIVKGRAPSPNPAPPKEHKNGTGTCSCCFSGIAITDGGKMAHHGYKRPGWGSQTASCAGIRFAPLEHSTEGLEWMIASRRRELAETEARIAAHPDCTEITQLLRRRGAEPQRRVTRLCDPDWPRVHRTRGEDLDRAKRAIEGDLEFLAVELVKWTPAPELDKDSEPSPEP